MSVQLPSQPEGGSEESDKIVRQVHRHVAETPHHRPAPTTSSMSSYNRNFVLELALLPDHWGIRRVATRAG
jgi:hypothetical protein